MSRFEQTRLDFDRGVAEVETLLALDRAGSSDLPEEGTLSPDTEISNGAALRRAAVVLLVSHFEGFLKTLAADMTDIFNTGEVEAGCIPRALREMQILPKFKRIVAAGDSNQRFALMKKLDNVSALWKNQAKPDAGILDADLVTRVISNAKHECIDALFVIFGEPAGVCAGEIDVWNPDTERQEPDSIAARLTDIVGCRNDIAHGDMERRPTGQDVRRYVLFLTALSRRLILKAEQVENAAFPSIN